MDAMATMKKTTQHTTTGQKKEGRIDRRLE